MELKVHIIDHLTAYYAHDVNVENICAKLFPKTWGLHKTDKPGYSGSHQQAPAVPRLAFPVTSSHW